jgi:hypothetical protein
VFERAHRGEIAAINVSRWRSRRIRSPGWFRDRSLSSLGLAPGLRCGCSFERGGILAAVLKEARQMRLVRCPRTGKGPQGSLILFSNYIQDLKLCNCTNPSSQAAPRSSSSVVLAPNFVEAIDLRLGAPT